MSLNNKVLYRLIQAGFVASVSEVYAYLTANAILNRRSTFTAKDVNIEIMHNRKCKGFDFKFSSSQAGMVVRKGGGETFVICTAKMKFPKQLHDLFVAHQKKRNSTQLSDHLTTQCVFKFNDIFECSNAPVPLELVSASLLGFQECYCRHAYSALAKKLKGARRLISHFMSKVGPVIDLDMNDGTFDEARFYLRHAAMLGARKLRKHCKKFKKHNDFHYLRAAVRKLGRSSSA